MGNNERQDSRIQRGWERPPGGDGILGGTCQEAEMRQESVPGMRDSQKKCPESRDGGSCWWNSQEAEVTGSKSTRCEKTRKGGGARLRRALNAKQNILYLLLEAAGSPRS